MKGMKGVKSYLTSKKVKRVLLVMVGLLFVFFIAGEIYYSKSNVINRYVSARQKEHVQMADLKPYLVWSDTKTYVTLDEARYSTFKTLSDDEAKVLKDSLNNATEDDDLYVTSIGKRWLFFSDYRIAMKPFQLTFKTNLPKMDILLNQKKAATSDSEEFTYTIDRLPIADYEATLSGVYKNKRVLLTKAYDGENPTIDLMVQFKSFDVVSNLADGDLVFGKERVATLSNGKYKVEDFPMTDDVDVFVKKTFTDGDIQSNRLKLASIENGSTVTLDVPNTLPQDDVGRYLVSAFQQFANYIITRQDPTDLSLFESGNANGFYKALKKSVHAKLFTDSRLATSLSIPDIWVNNIRQVGKESYAIDYGAIYSYYYDKATDPDKKTEGNLNQTVTGVAILKKTGESYVFQATGSSDVKVVNEDNKVKAKAIPDGLVGVWTTRLKTEKADVTVEISEDGSISKTIHYDDPSKADITYTAYFEEAVEVGSDVYRYTGISGDYEALIVAGGLGGVGVKYDYGFQLRGNTLTPVIWQAKANADFNYQKALSGGSLSRQ